MTDFTTNTDPPSPASTVPTTPTERKSLPITIQPRMANKIGGIQKVKSAKTFDDSNCERDWTSDLCSCDGGQRNCCCLCCCWPFYKYTIAIRLGETPFMPLIPCATFALRIKVRSLFGIKGSILRDFATTCFCEPCAVCQMTRELDDIGVH